LLDDIAVIMLKRAKSKKAFTIIEVVIAITVLLIAILGTSAYRYYAALSARRADLHISAARTALLLCEGWSGVGGSKSFDPVGAFGADLNITISVGPTEPDTFEKLGSYKILLEGNDYYVTLSSKDLAAELRVLNVIVSWDQAGRGTDSFENADKSYLLTTYVENPNL
jgi:prepilin-type N-terminal cleavage/methylation domain-containing protein